MRHVADSMRYSDALAAMTRRRARSIAPVVGACGALILHILVLGSVAFGWGGRPVAPHPREGLGANAIASTEEAVATLILIEEPGVGPRDEDSLDQLASHGVILRNFRLTIVTPEPSIDAAPDVDERTDSTASTNEESSGDRQAQAALFGLYLGQIQARIERAWLRPRTAIGAESFQCRVRILQSPQGDVQEVQLQRCNGDARWQVSLVQAIGRASPLPAPPKPSVFSRSIQLAFQGQPYVPGEPTDLYEPAIQPAIGAASRAMNLSEGY